MTSALEQEGRERKRERGRTHTAQPLNSDSSPYWPLHCSASLALSPSTFAVERGRVLERVEWIVQAATTEAATSGVDDKSAARQLVESKNGVSRSSSWSNRRSSSSSAIVRGPCRSDDSALHVQWRRTRTKSSLALRARGSHEQAQGVGLLRPVCRGLALRGGFRSRLVRS